MFCQNIQAFPINVLPALRITGVLEAIPEEGLYPGRVSIHRVTRTDAQPMDHCQIVLRVFF